jgi:DNA-binding transcriptional ArsR family regulator
MIDHERMADILKALGHPVRVQILEVLLAEGESCVCHLEAALGQRQAYVSQQLAVLRSAGLVVDRRDGLNIYYAPGVKGIDDLMAETRALARSVATAAGEKWEVADGWPPTPDDCPCPRCVNSDAKASAEAARAAGG